MLAIRPPLIAAEIKTCRASSLEPPWGDEDGQPFKKIPAGVAAALMINQ